MSWAVVATIAGIVSVIVTLIYGEVQRRLARKQLRLAQEEASLRPKLTITVRDVVFHYRPENPGSPLVQAAVVFDVANDGRSAAHNVRCEIRLDERNLEPDDMHGPNHDFFAAHIGPSACLPHQINAGVVSHGLTEARYLCVCDEVGKSEGRIEFEVPEWKREEQQ